MKSSQISEALQFQYLQLESGILFVFLVMLILFQLQRSKTSKSTGDPRSAALWTMGIFSVFSAGFCFYLSSISPLLAIELAAGATLSLLHPVNALCFFVQMLFLRPWEITTQNTLLLAIPRLLAGLCMVSLAIHPMRRGRLTAQVSRALILVLVLGAWLFVTTFEAGDVSQAQQSFVNSPVRAIIIFVMCLFLIENEESVYEFKYTLLISLMAPAVLGVYQYWFVPATGGAYGDRLHAYGMFTDPNDMAAMAIIAIPFAAAWIIRQPTNPPQRIIGMLLTSLSILAIWLSRSRGALLALAVMPLSVRFIEQPKKRLQILILASILGCGYYAATKIIPRSADDMESSEESRIVYWKAAINMTLHHPLFGVGYDQFPINYEAYSPSVKYEWGHRTAHSSWLLIFAEGGVVGGVLFTVFYVIAFKAAWRHRKTYPDQLYALIGYSVAMSFLSHTYEPYPYMLSGLILASSSVRELAGWSHA